MLKKLRSLILRVPELQVAKEWYIKATGISPYFDEPFYVGFDIQGYELGLDPDMGEIQKGNQAIAYWAVDDIKMVTDHFITCGASLVQTITNVGGSIQTVIIADPFGNQLGFIEGA